MKMKKYIFAIAIALVGLVSCDKYLDTMPDNRTEIDTEEKVKALLKSAYPTHWYVTVTEYLSDQLDNMSAVVSGTQGQFFQDLWNWKDNTLSNNSSPRYIWSDSWSVIACANQALEAIQEMGGPSVSPAIAEAYGEALICRAYAHFILVNVFCLHYDPQHSSTDLGIPYMETPEKGLNPEYERGNVADVYAKIDADIQEGLKYIGDTYDVPKWHFTRQAACAFATKFYLYYHKWDLAVKYADECLGSAPKSLLRDYDALQNNTSSLTEGRTMYNSTDNKCNLLMTSAYSNLGSTTFYNSSGANKHYAYTNNIALTEDLLAPLPWKRTGVDNADLRFRSRRYNSGSLSYILLWKVFYQFQTTNQVTGTGYARGIFPAFTADETLLLRAEAKVLLKQYDSACEDLNLWANNFYAVSEEIKMTPASITEFENSMDYYLWDKPTQKKHLHPAFPIDAEGSVQESMLQLCLRFHRAERWGNGERWFDVKRYGITIYRRFCDSNGNIDRIEDTVEYRDPRQAVQVPQECIDAGLQPNPRN